MYSTKSGFLGMLVLTAFFLGVIGCGDSGTSDIANLNGTWQNAVTKQKVSINLTGESKTVVIGDKALPVTIKPLEVDRYILRVSDPASGGEKDWKIFRIWDDIGKNFTLKFEHDGQTEDLERVKV